jgi:hypothetical protein
MKLNTEKYVLEYNTESSCDVLVPRSGIEANPEKHEAIWNMKESISKREVQKLTGRIASMN